MCDKYVIMWDGRKVSVDNIVTTERELLYFGGVEYKMHEWATMGSPPETIIIRSRLLSEAQLFDTKKEAELMHNHKAIWTDMCFIKEVTDKEIFSARLKAK